MNGAKRSAYTRQATRCVGLPDNLCARCCRKVARVLTHKHSDGHAEIVVALAAPAGRAGACSSKYYIYLNYIDIHEMYIYKRSRSIDPTAAAAAAIAVVLARSASASVPTTGTQSHARNKCDVKRTHKRHRRLCALRRSRSRSYRRTGANSQNCRVSLRCVALCVMRVAPGDTLE